MQIRLVEWMNISAPKNYL